MFTDNERYRQQSNEAKYIHLNAGIRLKSSYIPIESVPFGGRSNASEERGKA